MSLLAARCSNPTPPSWRTKRFSPQAGGGGNPCSSYHAGLLAGIAHADITVYTNGPQSLIEKPAEGFTAQSGVKVNAFQTTTGKVMARIEAEAANPVVDVLISASWDTAPDLAERGWPVPYASPNAEKVPD